MSELMPPVPQLLMTTTKQAVRNIDRTTEHGRATEYSIIRDVSSLSDGSAASRGERVVLSSGMVTSNTQFKVL